MCVYIYNVHVGGIMMKKGDNTRFGLFLKFKMLYQEELHLSFMETPPATWSWKQTQGLDGLWNVFPQERDEKSRLWGDWRRQECTCMWRWLGDGGQVVTGFITHPIPSTLAMKPDLSSGLLGPAFCAVYGQLRPSVHAPSVSLPLQLCKVLVLNGRKGVVDGYPITSEGPEK